jgi:perosamine synthetase
MYKPKKLILTAGPSISQKEIRYGLDAIENGWNEHYQDYIIKFEKKFAEYLGVKYALSVTSGTAALHLALLALGVGSGDEVIMPDQTFISIANAIKWTGATPVFVDVEEDTWCIDPKAFEKAITKRTKAVIPVYTYGQPPKMDEILNIARKHKLYVVEDACPAIGSLYKKKRAGSFGDFGAFSFQGAKIMVTGEGGMLVTNNKAWYEKAASLRTHGRDPHKTFWHNDIGFMYRISNLQAAIGLAQLERIDTFVKKKRQIYRWYKKRLSDIDGISMNTENDWSETNYWMPSIILNKKFTYSRDQLRKELYDRRVDTRPFFYPITMFDMYKKNHKVKTPISYHLGLNGINLPSGVMLTEKEVDYIAAQVRELLTQNGKEKKRKV